MTAVPAFPPGTDRALRLASTKQFFALYSLKSQQTEPAARCIMYSYL
jgi:hypothetical protein